VVGIRRKIYQPVEKVPLKGKFKMDKSQESKGDEVQLSMDE
jgi:hypothetical protein